MKLIIVLRPLFLEMTFTILIRIGFWNKRFFLRLTIFEQKKFVSKWNKKKTVFIKPYYVFTQTSHNTIHIIDAEIEIRSSLVIINKNSIDFG